MLFKEKVVSRTWGTVSKVTAIFREQGSKAFSFARFRAKKNERKKIK